LQSLLSRGRHLGGVFFELPLPSLNVPQLLLDFQLPLLLVRHDFSHRGHLFRHPLFRLAGVLLHFHPMLLILLL
jgi:hypothetical protein